MIRIITTLLVASAAAAAIFISGCSTSDPSAKPRSEGSNPSDAKPAAAATANDVVPQTHAAATEEHGHKPGEHGGIIVSLGRDSYHAEAVFEKGGLLRLYMLGQDESRVQEVDAQELVAYVKADGSSESAPVPLTPEPQPGDTEGKTSQFIAKLPAEVQGGSVDVTIPSIRIGGERFRMGFSSAVEPHGADEMPAKVSDLAEAELYLTAGGIYTKADIEANGNMTASQKFKGFRAAHDMKPKPGDNICPVTFTKANAKVSWVIGGKTYEFCCPPCVDEFVALAKESPAEIKEPEAYVKK